MAPRCWDRRAVPAPLRWDRRGRPAWRSCAAPRRGDRPTRLPPLCQGQSRKRICEFPSCSVSSSQLAVASSPRSAIDCWLLATASLLFHHQGRAFWQVALAPELVFHRGSQALQRDARADLHFAVTGWDRIVEHLVVGEVAHAEAVQPLQRTRMPLAGFFVFDSDLADEHASIVEQRGSGEPLALSTQHPKLQLWEARSNRP